MIKHLNSINNSFLGENKIFFNKKHLNNSEYKKVKIIKFNAWQYNNDEQIGFALLDSIYSKLSLKNKFRLRLNKIINIQNICTFILLFLSVWSLCYFCQSSTFLSNIFSDKDNIEIIIQALTLLISGGLIVFILNTFKHISNAIGEIFSFKHNKIFKENIDIKYTIKDNICTCLKNLNNNEKRIVIFIDDLDRCSEQSIISLLDTLIIYFSDDCDVVVVLNIDIAIILNAINSKLKSIDNKKNEAQAIKYLDKILQANYNIPKILSAKYENIINQLLPIQKPRTNTTVIDKNNDVHLNENNKLTIEKEENTKQNINNSQTIQSEIIQELPVDIIEELKLFLKENGELLGYNPRKIKRVINILKLLVNDLTYNNIEYDSKNLVASICILENYPELSIDINRIFENNVEFNINDINLDNIKNNDKITNLLNQYLSLIDKTQYFYIRKYIYDLSVITNNL